MAKRTMLIIWQHLGTISLGALLIQLAKLQHKQERKKNMGSELKIMSWL